VVMNIQTADDCTRRDSSLSNFAATRFKIFNDVSFSVYSEPGKEREDAQCLIMAKA